MKREDGYLARAEKLDAMLADIGIPARRISRGKKVGLYYKKESDIEEIGSFAKLREKKS